MDAVNHKLEAALRGVEARQVLGGGSIVIFTEVGIGVIDLHGVGVAHEIPLQVLGHGIHAVGRGLVATFVEHLLPVTDKLSAVPHHLLHLAVVERTNLLLEGGRLVEVGVVAGIVGLQLRAQQLRVGEVHEIDMVVVGLHLRHLILRRVLLQEDVTRHLVLDIDGQRGRALTDFVAIAIGLIDRIAFTIHARLNVDRFSRFGIDRIVIVHRHADLIVHDLSI